MRVNGSWNVGGYGVFCPFCGTALENQCTPDAMAESKQ